jgi:hypothetical protein
VLGNYLEVTLVTKVTAQTVVNVSVTAATALDSTLGAVVSATGDLDLEAIADTVVQAYGAFAATIEAQTGALAVFGAKAAPAIDVLIIAQGDFRMRSAPPTMMTDNDMGTTMSTDMAMSTTCGGGSCVPGTYCDNTMTCQPCDVDAHCGTSCVACGGGTPKCNAGSCVQCTQKSDCTNLLTPCCSGNVCVAGVC